MHPSDSSSLDWWSKLSPYLDKALTLNSESREAWLTSLRLEDTGLAELLGQLLDEQSLCEEEQFLEQPLPLLTRRAEFTGQSIGPYKLLSMLGRGGMGSVWLAERNDGRFHRRAAVKLLNLELTGHWAEQRFKREGTILSRLSHPCIADIIDAGVLENGQPFLILEYVDGTHIDTYCDSQNLDVESRVRLFLEVLDAVAHAHARLVIHRDIKPSNVLVTANGHVKLLDFGIAKLLKSENEAGAAGPLTVESGAALTPEFAAPEQLAGGPISTATDVYALGVLLYLLLSGEHPAGSGAHSPADLIRAVLHSDPPSLSGKLQHALSRDLERVVAKALRKSPEERYRSVTAFAEDLRRYLMHEPISVRPYTFTYRLFKFIRRHRTVAALGAFTFAVSMAGLFGTIMQMRVARSQRDFALRQLSRAESMNDLNSFLLSDAAPSGKPFTVKELLGRAEHIAKRQPENDTNRIDLLISIGRQYWSEDEDSGATRVLEQAYAVSRSIPEHSTRARASCSLASVLGRGRDLNRAQHLIQDGLREVSGDPQLILDRVFCLERGSEVDREIGAMQQAIERAKQAQNLLNESPLQSRVLRLHALMNLAESYSAGDEYAKSALAFQQASELLTALGRDETQTAATLLNNWALTLHLSGRPLEAEPVFHHAITVGTGDATAHAVSPTLFVNYARVLHELARSKEAAGYAERAYAAAKVAGDQAVINHVLIVRSVIYRSSGDLGRADAIISELQPRLERSLPPWHIAFASVKSERALIAQARGDLRTAMGRINEAIAITQDSVKRGLDGSDYIPILLVRRSGMELDARYPDRAAADAELALTLMQQHKRDRSPSCAVGRAWFALAAAREAQGRWEEARTAAQSAAEQLEQTLGTDHPETRAARRITAALHSSR